MDRLKKLLAFLSLDLKKIEKLRIILGCYVFSKFGIIKIIGLRIRFNHGLRNHSLLILKEVFLDQNYAFTSTTDSRLKRQKKGGGAVIVDIGANIGISTLYFKNRYPDVNLIAVEASPINYELLVENIKMNDLNIETINCFVSNMNGLTKFHHNLAKPGASFGEGFKPKASTQSEEFTVKTMKLSDLIRSHKDIVLKIDVEGAEYEILKDLADSENISEVMEIIVEVSTRNRTQFNEFNRVLNDFYDLGFEPRIISDYTTNMLYDKSKQGHLQLVLLRK